MFPGPVKYSVACLTLFGLFFNLLPSSLASTKASSGAQAAAAAAAAASSHGHVISTVNITDFLADLSRRLQFVLGVYQNRQNKTALAKLQSSSFIIAATKPPHSGEPADQSSQSYQAVIYVVAVLLCYAAAICAMVVFNFKERKSQAKYEAYEDVVKRPRNYLYHYFREKYKDPSAVIVTRKKTASMSANAAVDGTTTAAAKVAAAMGHNKAGSPSQLLSPTTERYPLFPLANKLSIASTDTYISSTTTPMSEFAYVPGGSLRRKTSTNLQSPMGPPAVVKDNVILLSPTVEESVDGLHDDGSINHASHMRSQFAQKSATMEYSFGGDSTSGYMPVEMKPSPYLVVDNLEESFTSSVGGEMLEAMQPSMHTGSQSSRLHRLKLCPTNSDISSGTNTPIRGSMHSFAGTSFADDDA